MKKLYAYDSYFLQNHIFVYAINSHTYKHFSYLCIEKQLLFVI